MPAQETSALLPEVECEFLLTGLRPHYEKYDPATMVTVNINIKRDQKSGKLPIQTDHPVRVAVWMKYGKTATLVFKVPEKPLEAYDGGQEGRIKFSGFRLIPFKKTDDPTEDLKKHIDEWHDFVVEFTPRGHQTNTEKRFFKWDVDRILPWFRGEITKFAKDAYLSNHKYLENIRHIIEETAKVYVSVKFDHGKDSGIQEWMMLLLKDVEETMVKVEELGGRTAIRAYTDVPAGKTVKPSWKSIICAIPIFETDGKARSVCLKGGQSLPITITVNFDRAHPKGPVPRVWIYLVQTRKGETGPDGKPKTDKTMCKYSLGECLIWFSDKNRLTGLIMLDDTNAVKLTDQGSKLKTGRYYLIIGIKSLAWEKELTRISETFTLDASPDSGESESST